MWTAVALSVTVLGALRSGELLGAAEDSPLARVLTEARETLGNSKDAQSLFLPIEREQKSAYAYTFLFEELYNRDRRDLALRLLDAARAVVTERPERLVEMRRALAQYELDVPCLEQSYRAELDAAIEGKAEYLPDSILQDRVIAYRVLPAYVQTLEKAGSNKALYELLRRAYSGRPELLLVCRARLASVPGDAEAARDFIYACSATKQHAALLDESTLPKAVKASDLFRQEQARAFLELGKVKEVANRARTADASNAEVRAEVRPAPEPTLEPIRRDLPALLAAKRAEVEKLPKNGQARGKLAGLLLESGKTEEGRSEMRQAAALGGVYLREPFRTLPTCLISMSDDLGAGQAIDLYAKAGVLASLEEDLAPLLKRSKGNEVAYLERLADHYEQAHDKPAAVQVRSRIAAMDPWRAP